MGQRKRDTMERRRHMNKETGIKFYQAKNDGIGPPITTQRKQWLKDHTRIDGPMSDKWWEEENK